MDALTGISTQTDTTNKQQGHIRLLENRHYGSTLVYGLKNFSGPLPTNDAYMRHELP